MIRCLSFHAGYACRRSGACCSSNWPIPIEVDRLEAMQRAIASGRLVPIKSLPFEPVDDAPDGQPAVLATASGRCVFFDPDTGSSCRVQTALGHDALPLACRQFPRVTVRDPGGVRLTLSAYCPTAARLLEIEAPVSIVDSPAAFPADAEYVGLDARDALPPLLTPTVLMDWESWWLWEALSVDLIANVSATPSEAVARLRVAVAHVETWTPRGETLEARVHEAFDSASTLAPLSDPTTLSDRTHLNFLASHAFANWAIHGRGGIRAWLRSIESAHALLASGLSMREADLRLRHRL